MRGTDHEDLVTLLAALDRGPGPNEVGFHRVTIEREPLLSRGKPGMSLDGLRRILGEDMQRWEGMNADEYYVGFTNTNASFLMAADDTVKAVNRMSTV